MDDENSLLEYNCSECGADVTADEKICHNCGANLEELVEIDNPDEPVTLDEFPNEIEAGYVIKYLAELNIKAYLLNPPSSPGKPAEVEVRKADYEKAKDALLSKPSFPQPMTLGDIFSNSISLIGKTFKHNVVVALVFLIPSGILLAFGMKSFFGYIYDNLNDSGIQIEEASVRTLADKVTGMGTIDSSLNVSVNINGSLGSKIEVGDSARISIEETHHSDYTGIVIDASEIEIQDEGPLEGFISGMVRIKINEPFDSIKPGAFCNAEIITETRIDVISVPAECIINKYNDKEEEKSFVYKFINGRADSVEVETGFSDLTYIEIISGVNTGDEIISGNYETLAKLSDGYKIQKEDYKTARGNGPVYFVISTLLVFLLCTLAVWVSIIKTAQAAADDKEISFEKIFGYIFSKTYLHSLGFVVFTIIALAALLFIPSGFGIIKRATELPIFESLGLLFFFVAWFLLILFFVKWSFAFIHLIVTGNGIIRSLKKSSFFVKEYWWRTFGILLLSSIIINFVDTLISTPVSFIYMWDFYSMYFKALSGNLAGSENFFSVDMMKALGFGFGLNIVLTLFIQSLISPLFYFVFYNDMRIRKVDIPVKLQENNSENSGLSIG